MQAKKIGIYEDLVRLPSSTIDLYSLAASFSQQDGGNIMYQLGGEQTYHGQTRKMKTGQIFLREMITELQE